MILTGLEKPSVKSALGVNGSIEQISIAIKQRLSDKGVSRKIFVLVQDECDVLMHDKRGKPSDFVYNLLVMEKSSEKGDI